MPRNKKHLLFAGIHNVVVALDVRDGAEVWRTKIGGMMLVNVLWDGVELFASAKGEIWKLDPATGELLWHNKLKGLGTGSVIMASSRMVSAPAATVVTMATNEAAARSAQ